MRTVRQVGDRMTFQSFLRLLAARSGQILNMTGIATELGLALNTAKAWISVLLASYQIIVLRPCHANLGKRLVKRPKVYFTDTGTLCYLVGLRDPLHAMQGPMAGAITKTAVVAEFTGSPAAGTAEGLRPAVQPGYVVYAGDRVVPLGGGVTGPPLGSL